MTLFELIQTCLTRTCLLPCTLVGSSYDERIYSRKLLCFMALSDLERLLTMRQEHTTGSFWSLLGFLCKKVKKIDEDDIWAMTEGSF